MLALRRKSFGCTCEHVTPLNSEEGAFFFNVILPIACSKLYRESGKMVGAAGFNFVGARKIGSSIQSLFFFEISDNRPLS